MGSKKHKKHKSEKKDKQPEVSYVDRPPESLKIVLKVGGSSASEHGDSPHVQPHPEVYLDNTDKNFRLPEKHKKSKKKKKKKSSDKDRDREKKHKHHHHHHEKKDKQRKREHSEEPSGLSRGGDEIMEGMGNLMDAEESQEPPAKQALYEEESVPERSFREPRACTLKNRQGKSALQHLLDYLLKTLEKKDPQQFFAWPVTDHIAPGYSSIIAHPMDFSTMRTKIDNNEYDNLDEFMVDFKLMCDNAMTYNRPDTIYYKAAKKLLHVGLKMATKEKLLDLRTTCSFMNELTRDELGFDTNDAEDQPPRNESLAVVADENAPVNKEIKKKQKPVVKPSKMEIGDDGMTPEEILAQAKKAARAAADKLTLRRPNSKFGFLRQQNDGSTSLAILNPTTCAREERRVNLEMLVGKLQTGTGTLASFKEDKRNVAKPVNYVNYGNYGSYAPTYDSTFANLTKEESDLLYSTYGDETGVQYAESLLNFTRDCPFANELADNLLNVLTNGEHTKTAKMLEAKKKVSEVKKLDEKKPKLVQQQQQTQPPPRKDDVSKPALTTSPIIDFDFESLKTLTDEGIDMSFLDSLEKQLKKDPIQKKLDETTGLLQDLAKVQNARLSAKPPPHLAHVSGPSTEELQLAAKVTESLTELTKKATPGEVMSVDAIRKAMGISGDLSAPFDVGDELSSDMDNTKLTAAGADQSHLDGSSSVTEGVPMVTSDDPRHLPPLVVEPVSGPNSNSAVDDAGTVPEVNADDQARDLEVELREFLETGPGLRDSDSPSHVDVSLDDVIP